MPTLTRGLGFSDEGINVLPVNKLHSIAIMQTADSKRHISVQKLRLQASPIGGLEIGWKDAQTLVVDSRTSANSLLAKTVAYHANSMSRHDYKFIVNEPELWIYKEMSRDVELWIPLMLEALISGVGIHRKELMLRLNELSNKTFSKKLIPAYKLHSCRIDGLYTELMAKDKKFLMALAAELMEKPHELLGLKVSHVSRLESHQVKQFQRCRPFWATDIDSLEEILQTPSDAIFAVYRKFGTSWANSTNACWKAAENLGYVIPDTDVALSSHANTIVEIKPAVSSDVKDSNSKLIAA